MEAIKHEVVNGYCQGPWVLHPSSFKTHEAQGKTNYVLAEANLGAAYEYDDYALVYCAELKTFYLLNTSGCSCPSPDETGVELAKTDNCTSWRELQEFVAKHLPWEVFAVVVAGLNTNRFEINRICFDNQYMSWRY